MSKKEKKTKNNKEQPENGQFQEQEVIDQQAEAKEEKNDQIEDQEKQLEELKMHNAELKDKYLRLFAEFDNYKKRTIREKLEIMKTAAEDTLTALLPVLDDFDRAKKNAEDENNNEVFSEGVNLVYGKLYNILSQKGLEPMTSNGEVFDPELHEAFTEIPAPSKKLRGKIVDTIETGYKLKDKIIRYPKVVVGK
ncbi:MAG: nucleotide exchange factor GrpE [Desulfobulbaceae bacterium]|nr:nucleotide exchange factor GrpE [Desulfobulbaceae bacterium]